jgi:hypothetical protein
MHDCREGMKSKTFPLTREGIKSKSKARHHYDHHQASCRREGSVIFDHVIFRTSSKNETNLTPK